MPDDMSNALPEKPKVDQADVTSVMSEIERSTAQTLSTNPNATHEQSALNDTSVSGRPQPALERDGIGYEHDHQAAEHIHQQTSR